jgi:hypothetical protein
MRRDVGAFLRTVRVERMQIRKLRNQPEECRETALDEPGAAVPVPVKGTV